MAGEIEHRDTFKGRVLGPATKFVKERKSKGDGEALDEGVPESETGI